MCNTFTAPITGFISRILSTYDKQSVINDPKRLVKITTLSQLYFSLH